MIPKNYHRYVALMGHPWLNNLQNIRDETCFFLRLSSVLSSSSLWNLYLKLLFSMQYWSDKADHTYSICISWRDPGGRLRGNEVTRLFFRQLISWGFSGWPCHLLAANENEDWELGSLSAREVLQAVQMCRRHQSTEGYRQIRQK